MEFRLQPPSPAIASVLLVMQGQIKESESRALLPSHNLAEGILAQSFIDSAEAGGCCAHSALHWVLGRQKVIAHKAHPRNQGSDLRCTCTQFEASVALHKEGREQLIEPILHLVDVIPLLHPCVQEVDSCSERSAWATLLQYV